MPMKGIKKPENNYSGWRIRRCVILRTDRIIQTIRKNIVAQVESFHINQLSEIVHI
jgi:hypothetical protein